MKTKINKLLNMSKGEVAFRLREKLIEESEYLQYRMPHRMFSHRRPVPARGRSVSERPDLFFTDTYNKCDRIHLVDRNPGFSGKWIEAADEVLEGKISLLGQAIDPERAYKWNHDPLSDIQWPLVFYNRVSRCKSDAGCDVKYVWELNRHQYLIVLAKAYWLTGKERYAEKIVFIIRDWIDANPYNTGVNWTSSLELAVRAISWIWALSLCKGSLHLSPEFHSVVTGSLYEHGLHISKHLSFYSSPYNHLIGEAAGLHLIGLFRSGMKKNKEWERLGWKILEDQIEKQFHEDGMSVEQASFYHHFTLGFYLQSLFLRRYNGKNVSKRTLNRLEKALEFSMHLTRPDGRLPMIGDIDNARSLYFNSEHSWDFRGFLGLGSVLFDRPDFKAMGGGLTEDIFWILNEEDMRRFGQIDESEPSERSRSFPSSGYHIFRNSWNSDAHYLCFDCGEIAEGLSRRDVPSAAHGHADALSFELSVYGKPIFSEGGFYTYFGDLDWHKHFRHEEAHNTVQIGHHRQADYCGRLTWMRVKKVMLTRRLTLNNHEYVCGTIAYDETVRHMRQVLCLDGGGWFFNDTISVEKKDTPIHTSFNFDPSVSVEIDEKNRTIIAKSGNAGIVLSYFKDVTVKAFKGAELPSGGWSARGYGIKAPAWTVTLVWQALGQSTVFPFVILPWQAASDLLSVEGGFCDETNMFEIGLSGGGNLWRIELDNEKTITLRGGGEAISLTRK